MSSSVWEVIIGPCWSEGKSLNINMSELFVWCIRITKSRLCLWSLPAPWTLYLQGHAMPLWPVRWLGFHHSSLVVLLYSWFWGLFRTLLHLCNIVSSCLQSWPDLLRCHQKCFCHPSSLLGLARKIRPKEMFKVLSIMVGRLSSAWPLIKMYWICIAMLPFVVSWAVQQSGSTGHSHLKAHTSAPLGCCSLGQYQLSLRP